MNKKLFIEKLSKKLDYDIDKCSIINDILENNFIIGKNNKDKIINQLMSRLNINDKVANNIYEVVMEIIGSEIKDKIKFPFIH